MATSAGVYHYGCPWMDFLIKVRGVYCGLVEARSAVSDGYVSLMAWGNTFQYTQPLWDKSFSPNYVLVLDGWMSNLDSERRSRAGLYVSNISFSWAGYVIFHRICVQISWLYPSRKNRHIFWTSISVPHIHSIHGILKSFWHQLEYITG